MINVSTNTEDFTFESADDVIKFVQTAMQEKSEIWIYCDEAYPCISVCINGKYAVVHFFKMKQVICGCPITRIIKKKLLLL